MCGIRKLDPRPRVVLRGPTRDLEFLAAFNAASCYVRDPDFRVDFNTGYGIPCGVACAVPFFCPAGKKEGERRSGEEKTVRGGHGGQGRNKTQGRKQRLRSCPLVQQTPALHCDRCPFLWNGEHVLVLLAVD